ncbi:MAG TPA: TonB-dependent receptor plug domain-containing protein [Croceibacterium sp.]|nr:TonB-dependent receptor plug domain-containing protein [Croceibacterium sp.]
MKGLRSTSAALAVLAAAPLPAWAQDSGDAPPPVATEEAAGEPARDTYVPADFARFAPKNALDMLRQVPGFTIISADQGRGLGQANENVLINGERIASKSESVIDQLNRITSGRVERIEIVDGASLGIPGLSGQVANIVTKAGDISGRFEYRAIWRPRYAKTSFGGGEISVSGATSRLEWSAAYTHGTGRGGAGGGEGAIITDGFGNVLEHRDNLIQFVGEFPRLSTRVKWDGPGSLVANFNANHSRTYTDFSNDETRDLVADVDVFRDFDNDDDGYSYEFGGDVEFPVGPGRLKLIGLESYGRFSGPAISLLIPADGSPPTGSRFDQVRENGEHIGRGEYRWNMLGGSWQLDAEAAFNRYSQVSGLSFLDTSGEFVPIPFPSGTGGVTEDRYEVILNHNRTLGKGLSLQFGAGGEYSKLAQTGPGGLVRTFWRPKGSATLAWTPVQGLDLSLKLARTVGQLSFGDFLASVNLAQDTGNAGNVQLVPQQAWEADFEAKKNLQAWGSATLRLYGRLIEDYIDIIPVAGGESRGNIVGDAKLYGASLNATINLDPLGWKGAKINANGRIEDSNLADPLTGLGRPFSSHNYTGGEFSLRYDVPDSDWALGGGVNWSINRPYVRLFEVGQEYEGPVYSFGFIENKDVFGLTVNLNVFNLSGGQSIFDRTVWTGLRDRTPIEFHERRRNDVSTIYRLTVRGSF